MIGRKPIPDSHGRLNSQPVTTGGVGAEWSITVPANRRWEVLAVMQVLVTDATVATRRSHLLLGPTGTNVYRIPSNTTQVASLTYQYFFQPSVRDAAAAIVNIVVQPLPVRIIFPEGGVISTSTENLQAGDQYTSARIFVMEWIEQIA